MANTDESGGASGAHFNPLDAPHGCYPDQNREAGDLIADLADNTGVKTFNITDFDLNGEHSILGRAIVIHQDIDDCSGGHGGTGNAGPRVAHGVLGTRSLDDCVGCMSSTALGNCQSLVARIAATDSVEATEFTDVTNYGTVSFISAACDEGAGATGINMRVCLSGLEPGSTHGLHVHQYGDWSTADAVSTGGHWNLFEQVHGFPTAAEHHSGDLGNVVVDENGAAAVFLKLPMNPNAFSMNDLIGLAVVLHAGTDDGVTARCC